MFIDASYTVVHNVCIIAGTKKRKETKKRYVVGIFLLTRYMLLIAPAFLC